jgi:two-component system, chemotaxis family, chemotaxis protein CheY
MAFNILIVDDSPIMRQVIKKTVQLSGIDLGEIYEAGHGQEALTQVRNNWVDLVLTDINMPVMDGITFIKELKSDEMLKSIPVIVISTEGRDDVVQKALELGAAHYITKPFRPEDIGRDVLTVLGYHA